MSQDNGSRGKRGPSEVLRGTRRSRERLSQSRVHDRRVEVGPGVELAVRCWQGGRGTPFLLVHGLASNLRLWEGVGEALSRRGYPVVAVDQRGHGLSDKPDEGYDFSTMVSDLLAVISATALTQPIVVGQSWGGNVVVELASRHPELVSGVACIDGGFIELVERFPTWEACCRALEPPMLTGVLPQDLEEAIRLSHPDWPEVGIQGSLACFDFRADGSVALHLSRERHLRILRHLWEHRPSSCFPHLRVPVLIVATDDGNQSWTASRGPWVSRAEASLSRVRTQWLSADHDVHAQRPEELAELLHQVSEEGFFSRSSVTPSRRG